MYNKNILYALVFILVLILGNSMFFKAPSDFPAGAIFSVPEGSSLRGVSLKLKNENIIASRTAFEAFIIMYGGERHVMQADYLFEDAVPAWEVARRISRGERHLAPVKVTIPEGFKTSEIAESLGPKLKNFNKTKFLLAAKDKEGYLFPDTYFFLTTDDEAAVLRSMNLNFEKKVLPILPEIAGSGKSEKDIVIMASLIEGESKGDTDRTIISGILWKRISIGMALQVDVAPDTYKHKGLPPSPIGNPGLEAIEAAIHPTPSTYLYYLHDKNGVVHYAKTLSEHNANIRKYLK